MLYNRKHTLIKKYAIIRPIVLMALGVLFLISASCKKYTDQPGKSDPRLARKYCNDPSAVNYNRDFPGTEDNSICYYPTDVFKGQYTFTDSIYSGASVLVSQMPLILTASA